MEKLDLNTIKENYHTSNVCMGETLAATPAEGLSVEEAFELYIRCMQWAEGDKFFVEKLDEDEVELFNE